MRNIHKDSQSRAMGDRDLTAQTGPVRGGRLTKFKGVVASISPGLCVATTSALLLTGGVAQAADECGVIINGEVTCAAGTYGTGISYDAGDEDVVLTLDDTDIVISNSGDGINVTGNGDISVVANFGSINTSGDNARGIYVETAGLGAALVRMEGGTVTTEGQSARGLYVTISNTTNAEAATALLTGGGIETIGDNAYGAYAQTNGLGSATVEMTGGTVSTGSVDGSTGARAYGLVTYISNGDSAATAQTTIRGGGEITTTGQTAHGLYSWTNGSGAAIATIDDSSVTTAGLVAYGLYARNAGAGTATVEITDDGGSITTAGDYAHGIFAATVGLGDALAQMDGGTVTTSGEEAHGINTLSDGGMATVILGADAEVTASGTGSDGILANGATGYDVDVAGSVTGGSGTSAAIHTISTAGGSIDIASTAMVDGSASGIALLDDDGDAVITSAGMVIGDIDGSAGNDTVNLLVGSITRSSAGNLNIAAESVSNAGTISVQDGVAGDVITVAGDYSGSNGVIVLDTVLGGDGSGSDMLVITGDTSGETTISLANLGGGGALTTSGIEVITVAGNSNGTFVLDGNYVTSEGEQAVTAGGYAYTLVKAEDGSGSWMLQSEIITDGSFVVLNEGDAAIVTTDDNAYGLHAYTDDSGPAEAQMNGSSITTEGQSAHGLYAQIDNANSEATATALLKDGDIAATGRNGDGLRAQTSGLGAALARMDGGMVTTEGETAEGLYALITNADSVATATALLTSGDVETVGDYAGGLRAQTFGLGDVLAQMDGGTVTTGGETGGYFASGLFAEIANAASEATATALMTGEIVNGVWTTTVVTKGADASGVRALTTGLGAALVQMDGGKVTTEGEEAHGLYAQIDNTDSEATATALLTGGDVTTSGATFYGAYGLHAYTNGLGDALVQMDGGTVTTSDFAGRGLYAQIDNATSIAAATALMTDGDIETSGQFAHGLWAYTNGLGAATARMDAGSVTTSGNTARGLWALSNGGLAVVNLGAGATVTSSGVNSDGILAEGATGYDVDVAGSVTGGSGAGAAIRTISTAGGSIDIASTAMVDGSASGTALVDDDGDAVITSAGTIIGDIDGGLGTDTVNLLAGSITRSSAGNLNIAAESVSNAGTISVQDGVAGDVVTIDGDYSGSGVIVLDTVLGGDGSGTDVLAITGDTSGETTILLANLGGGGALTTSGIEVITVAGNSNGTFVLDGNYVTSEGEQAVTAGGFAYTLVKAEDGSGSWMLQSEIITDGSFVVLNEGDAAIVTTDDNAYGLYAYTDDFGPAEAQMNGSSITTEGETAHGLYAQIANANSEATATALMTDGDIETTGGSAHGLAAVTNGLGDALAQMEGGKVTTGGYAARGLYAQIDNTDSEATATALMKDGDIETTGDFAAGLRAQNSGLGDATVRMEGGTVTTGGETSGESARGLWAEILNTDSTGTATALLTDGDVTTFGDNAYGLYAYTNSLGDVLAQMDGGTVTTSGYAARGLYAKIDNPTSAATATALLTGGDIETVGDYAAGLRVDTRGSSDALARMDGGTVTTEGDHGRGLWVEVNNTASTATATALITAGDIETTGDNAHGLFAYTIGLGDALAQMDGGTVTTEGFFAVGLFAYTTGLGDALAQMDGGTVTTEGQSAYGLYARSVGGMATVILGAGATVTASGLDADGIVAWGATGYDVDVAGSVTGGSGFGAAIYTNSTAGGTIDIASTAMVDGSASGIALVDDDGDAVITSAGMVIGDIDGGLGTDTVNLLAGSITRSSAGNLNILAESVSNAGTISVQDGVAGDVITIDGDYSGSDGSMIALDVADMLVVTGSTSGETTLSITNLGDGDVTALEIDVVSVAGDANGTFTLDGNYVTSDGKQAVIAGAYVYTLETSQTIDINNIWVSLTAGSEGDENYGATAPIYESYAQSLLAFNAPSSLRQRGSAQDYRSRAFGDGAAAATQSDVSAQQTASPLWIQMGTEQITSNGDNSTTDASLTSSIWEMNIGGDMILSRSASGFLVGGLGLSYATGSTDITSSFGDGSIATTGLGLSLAATWYDYSGFYVDGQVAFTSYASDLTSASIGGVTSDNGGTGFALSMEAGKQYQLDSGLVLIPQAQLSLSSVDFDSFTGANSNVALNDAESNQLRLGMEFEQRPADANEGHRLYGIVNLFHDFGAGSDVDVSGVSLTRDSDSWAAGVGLGGSYAWTDQQSIFGEATYATGLDAIGENNALSMNAGFKMTF